MMNKGFYLKIKEMFILKRYILMLFLGVFLCNVFLSCHMSYPIITDEYASISISGFLSNQYDWSTIYKDWVGDRYYGFGLGIFLIPLFCFIKNIRVIYIFVLILNSFFIALIPVFAYKTLHIIGDPKEERKNFIISLSVGLIPGFTILSKYAFSESLLFLLAWIAFWILVKLDNVHSIKSKVIYSIILGLLTGFAYMTHGRGIVLLLVVGGLFFIYLIFRRKHLYYFSIYAVIFYIMNIVNSYVKEFIINHVVFVGENDAVNTFSSSLGLEVFTNFKIKDLYYISKGLIGQFYYLINSTFGLIIFVLIVCSIFLFKLVLKKRPDNIMLTIPSIYTMLITIGSLLISVLFFSDGYINNSFSGKEYWMYGRYTEIAVSFVFFISFYYIFYKIKVKKSVYFTSFILVCFFLSIGSYVVYRAFMFSGDIRTSYTMISNIVPFTGYSLVEEDVSLLNFIVLDIVCILIFGLVIYAIKKSKLKIIWCTFIILFIYSSVFSLDKFVYPTSKEKLAGVESLQNQLEPILRSVKSQINKDSNIFIINTQAPLLGVQIALKNNTIHWIGTDNRGYERLAQVKEGDIIISPRDEKFDLYIDNIIFLNTYDQYNIWIYGEHMVQYYTNVDKSMEIYNHTAKSFKYEIIERDRDVFYSGNFWGSEGTKKKNKKFIIPNNEYTYGPYVRIPEGKYYLHIYGENLDHADVSVTYSMGAGIIKDLSKVYEESNYVVYELNMPFYTDNGEIILENNQNSDIDIILDKMELEYISEKIEITDMSTVVWDLNEYVSGTVKNRNSMLLSSGDASNQKFITVRPGEYFYIPNIKLRKGLYELHLYGSNISSGQFSFMNQEGDELFLELDIIDNNEIKVVLNIESDLNDYRLKLINDNEFKLYVQSVTILNLGN